MDIVHGKLYAVLTGDIVGSTKLPKNELIRLHMVMEKGVEELLRVFPRDVPGIQDIFRGDSWQMVVVHPSRSLRVALFYRAFLRAHMGKFKMDTRVAIAVGTIDLIIGDRFPTGEGEAFRSSGRLLGELEKHQKMAFVLNGTEKDTNLSLCLRTIVEFIDAFVMGWTEKQAQAILGVLEGWTQQKIAGEWRPAKITQQAVAQHIERAGWLQVEKGIKFFEDCLKELE
jgi:hypothetical protein